jgi:hypothetical protein
MPSPASHRRLRFLAGLLALAALAPVLHAVDRSRLANATVFGLRTNLTF